MKMIKVTVVCIAAIVFIGLFTTGGIAQENEEVDPAKVAFDAQYARINEFVENYHGWRGPTMAGRHLYIELANLGPQVLPYIVQEIEAGDWWLGVSARLITGKAFEREDFDDPVQCIGAQPNAVMFCRWWRAGKAASDARFERLYSELVAARNAGDQEAVDATLFSIRKLGIAALPDFVEKIQQGDPDLTGVVAKLTGMVSRGHLATVSADATPEEVAQWWAADKQHWLIPWPEKPKQPEQPAE